MDWRPKMLSLYPDRVPLPFFMSYPEYLGAEQEKDLMKDLEYLQQMYPNEVKRYQRRISEILDRFDYADSMIYDEYPDKYSVQKMAATMIDIMKREEQGLPEEERVSPEKWIWLQDMIQVLLCHEIYKRRHGGQRSFLKF